MGGGHGWFLWRPVLSCSHRPAPTLQVHILPAWERCRVRCPSTWVARFSPRLRCPVNLQSSFHHHHTHYTHSLHHRHHPALPMPDFYPNDSRALTFVLTREHF